MEYIESMECGGFHRHRVQYPDAEGSTIPAFLFVPKSSNPCSAVLVHHQHNSERHLGKSEVAGLAGDPLQAFGPALAELGFVVLAPDSICFEDRRKNARGTEPHTDPWGDWQDHMNEMAYRLVTGDTLMRKILHDASIGLQILIDHPRVNASRIGAFGHSYGGNTVLFQAAADDRIAFACSSGAACSYKCKMESGIPLELALILPGAAKEFDIVDLVKDIAPRALLLISASEDRYSKDADEIYSQALPEYSATGVADKLQHLRYEGGHALTAKRREDILEWMTQFASH